MTSDWLNDLTQKLEIIVCQKEKNMIFDFDLTCFLKKIPHLEINGMRTAADLEDCAVVSRDFLFAN